MTSLLSFIGFGVAMYVLLCALLYWRQDNSVFFPLPNDSGLRRQFESSRVQIARSDVSLEGWWIETPDAPHRKVILYFGGNAEDVLYTAAHAQAFSAQGLLVVNYRGYGRSGGRPSQDALYADSLAIYDYLTDRGIDPEDIVVAGRSLGSAMATMVAANKPVAGAILITPFDSLAAVAARHYPFVPVRWLLRHPFPSSELAGRARTPALILAAANDWIVPAEHARALYEAWAGPKAFHLLDAGHNDIDLAAGYYGRIEQFLAQLER